jgi:glutathione synthase
MRIGIAVSRAASIEPSWTTAHLGAALLQEGHTVRVIEPWDFEIDENGRCIARTHAFDSTAVTPTTLCKELSMRMARRCYEDLRHLDALLLRVNPLDVGVLSFALLAQASDVLVLNNPSTIVSTSHKGFLANLKEVPKPKTIVTRSRTMCHAFTESFESGVIVKPARSSGGRGVQWVRRGKGGHLDLAIDEARSYGDGYLVIQEYLESASEGEKRLLWVGNKVVGAYLRERAPGEFRHNLRRGGTPVPAVVTEEDQALVRLVSPHLQEQGVWIAGLDVIGGKIVEVNTLNPGGFHHIQAHCDRNLAPELVDSLVERIREEKSKPYPVGISPLRT